MVIDDIPGEPGGGIIPPEQESEDILLATINYSETAQASNGISDLTGYTWVGNENADIYTATGSGSDSVIYSINFVSKNNNYNSFELAGGGKNYAYLNYSNQQSINAATYYRGTITWSDQAYKTIVITGGTDATNAELIEWLEANGTLTAPIQANTYNITHTLTNLSKGNITLQITPDNGYTYPTTLTVSNGTIVSYDNTTGVAVISGDDTTIVSGECVAQPSGYSGNISGTYYPPTTRTRFTKIKFDALPTSDNDYDSYVDENGVLTGLTSYQNKTKVYVWGLRSSVTINGTTYDGGDDSYSTAEEVLLIGNYDIELGCNSEG